MEFDHLFSSELAQELALEQELEEIVSSSRALVIHNDDFNTFDFVIAEGAISYCSKEHQKAIGELVRVAKKGAYILASVNNRWALAKVILDKFGPKEGAEHIKNLLETGDAFTDLPVHAFTVDELKASFNSAGANVTKIYGKHTLSFLMNKEQKEELDDGEVFEKFEAFEKVLMEREELVGWAHHLLAVAKKF